MGKIDANAFPTLNDCGSLICQSATIPRRTLTTSQVAFMAKNFSLPATEQFTHEWQTTILLTQKMNVYTELRQMILNFSSLQKNSGGIRTIPNFDIELNILDQYSKINKNSPQIVLKGAYPTTVGDLQLQYEENSQVRPFNVTFTYQYSYFARGDKFAIDKDPLRSNPIK